MGQLFNRVKKVLEAEFYYFSKSDLETVLEVIILDMQEEVQLRQAVVSAVARQKRTQQQYEQAQAEVNKWQRRAQLALQKGDENLARQALKRKMIFAETANTLKANLDKHCGQADTLKRRLNTLESKNSEDKTEKDMLKARISAAIARMEQLQSTWGRLGTNSATAAFERMEEKVLMQEARAQSAAELGVSDLESLFAALESGSGVDELAALIAQMSLPPSTYQNPPSLPPAFGLSCGSKSNQVVDLDLEQLIKQLDQL